MLFYSFVWSVLAASVALAKTHKLNYTASWVTANPDGLHEKRMIGFNGEWPLPDIHVEKGDRVELYLTNGFQDNTATSLHFHGLFQNTSLGNQLQMDGPSMVTQCPIVPGQTYLYNFTVPEQVGTFWYHAHMGAQYGDGMRGAFIIHDPEEPFEYDHERVITLSDHYHENYKTVTKEFLSRYNPTGAEPIPQNILFNNTMNVTLDFTPGETYLFRFLNVGLFVSQYIILEDHEMSIVEVDGVYVKPNFTDSIYLSAGQRMSVLIKAKDKMPTRNYAMMQIMDETMLDVVPPELQLNQTIQMRYGHSLPEARALNIEDCDLDRATNDFYLEPLIERDLLAHYDHQIVMDVRMVNLGDGVKYAFFNNITYVTPKVPTLTTLLTSGKLASDPRIYGDNINAQLLKHNDIIEVVLNNYDSGRHPFHLHGHDFQIVQKSPGFHVDEAYDESEQDEMTVPYNESAPLQPFPERPMVRDTVVLEPSGHVVLRFRADNPGVWYFHCHVDWHLQQGLASVFIEAPALLQEREKLNENYLDICKAADIPVVGNAAGHSNDWFDLKGLPRQPEPLPKGFTTEGYLALIISTIIGVWGLYSIAQYGIGEVIPNDEKVYHTLREILAENEIEVSRG